MAIRKVLGLGFVFVVSMVAGAGAQITATGPVQRFAITTPKSESCNKPPGFCNAPLLSLPITLTADSYLTITFSAKGEIKGAAATGHNSLTIECVVDGTPCDPGNVQFEYPANLPSVAPDTRSFTWIASALKGTHTVQINGTVLDFSSISITHRTLNVDAIAK